MKSMARPHVLEVAQHEALLELLPVALQTRRGEVARGQGFGRRPAPAIMPEVMARFIPSWVRPLV